MWTYSAGERPFTCAVCERKEGGPLYVRIWDAEKGLIRLSLGHRDKARAKRYAVEQAARLQKGEGDIGERVTLAQIFAAYLQHRSPTKVVTEQKADKRRAEMWTRVLGKTDPNNITLGKWDAFIAARGLGAIDARGEAVAENDRKPVRPRTVEEDCDFLRQVLNFAVKWHLGGGRYLLRANPVRGYAMPHEANPLRPVASEDRYEALRAVSDCIMMEIRESKKGKREMRRSYLSELLDLAHETGRRISAVCSLRFEDLRLERTKDAPYGSIVWPASTDKMKRETTAPLTPSSRAAVDRVISERPGIGPIPLFPSARDASQPITKDLAATWLRAAEKMAKLVSQKGGCWHPFRRAWATCRKDLPDADVAAAGGWKSTASLKLYQQADAATMLAVVLRGGQLRELRG